MQRHPVPPDGPRTRRRGRPPSISRLDIARAVVDVGFDDLTVGAVAKRLGVSHPTLYSHVADRDDMVLLGAGQLLDTLDPPVAGTSWRELLDREAWLLWELFAEHPGLIRSVEATGRYPVALPQRFGAVCAGLLESGFTPDDALVAADAVYDLVVDSSARGAAMDGWSDDARASVGEQFSGAVPPTMAAAMRAAFTADPRQWFGKKLTLLLDGIAVGTADAVAK